MFNLLPKVLQAEITQIFFSRIYYCKHVKLETFELLYLADLVKYVSSQIFQIFGIKSMGSMCKSKQLFKTIHNLFFHQF